MHGCLAYEISNGLTSGVNISYDESFDTRVSADLKVRFSGASTTVQLKEVQQQQPVINALTSTTSNRNVRVHDVESELESGFIDLAYLATHDIQDND